MKHTLLIALLLIALLLGGVVQAQDDAHLDANQRAVVETVNAAIDGLRTAGSYAASGTQEQHQNSTLVDDDRSSETHSTLKFEAELHFTAEGALAAAQGRLGNTSDIQSTEARPYHGQVIASFIVIDNQLYQQFTLLPPTLVPNRQRDSPFMNQWHVLSAADLLAINQNEYGLSAFTMQSLAMPAVTPTLDVQLRITGMLDLLDEALVIDAAKLRSDVLDEQPVVVYEVSLDPFLVTAEASRTRVFGAIDLTEVFDADTFQALVAIFREQQHIQHRYWIGVNDQRLYQVEIETGGEYNTQAVREAIPALEGSEFWSQQNITFVTDSQLAITFGAFGEAASIEAPPDADSFLAWYD